ncbi:MAG: hypothetical protein ABMA25_00875 [Ilumatobacteraceae bacterium]
MSGPLTICVGNNTLATYAGSELWTYTLVAELQRRGHHATAFSPDLGAIASKLEALGIPCTADVHTVPRECDVIICNHHDITTALHRRLPHVPIIAVVHGISHRDPHTGQRLPEHPVIDFEVEQYVAVSEEVQTLLRASYDIDAVVLRNFFDLGRFAWTPDPFDGVPRNILINCNYSRPQDDNVRVMREVAAHYGAQLRTIGANFQEVGWAVEDAISDSDVVVGMGRSVLEGFCMGKLALVHGRWGTGGVVTEQTYDVLKLTNFSGRNSNGRLASAGEIVGLIDDAIGHRQSEWQRQTVETNHDVRAAAASLVQRAEGLLRSRR